MSLPAYAELHCISNFSFLRGASFPEELVQEAMDQGYSGLAITDECSLAGVVRAHAALKGLPERSKDFRLIVGSEFISDDGIHLVLLAPDRQAYAQISALITLARRDCAKGDYHLSRDMLAGQNLSACLALWIAPGSLSADLAESREPLRFLARLFPDRLWLAVELWLQGDDREQLARLQAVGQALQLPLCAAGGVQMHRRSRRPLRDTLTAIRLTKPVAELGFALPRNGEQYLRSRRRLARLYPPKLLQESVTVAQRCHFSLDELRYEYPHELVPEGHSPQSWLRFLAEQGMHEHWPVAVPQRVRDLVERELALVAELGYEHFFLTVHDLVVFARGRDILCQGRGSAANSALCYCLGITAVDPSRMQLLFERFLSRERDEPPDIDVDFEHERREEVIQYIYQKYGRQRAALAATVIRYRRRSAIRDVGKALGLGPELIDFLLEELRFDDEGRLFMAPDAIWPEQLARRRLRQLCWLVREIIGFPRHLSQHVGGFVISEGPLHELVPVENASMPGRTVIQWEKDDLETLGLLKVDVLALGMLTVIRKALAQVSEIRGTPLTLAGVPAEDPAVYEMISRADTVGVFQIESRAQMSMLPRLQPRNYYDLVIQIAIVRPGPIQGDMVHPYLARRKGEQSVSYPGEAVRSVLERTLGVPIFQEQVMQIAMVAAGFSGGEADSLRRAMAAWKRKGGLEPFRDRLVDGMLSRGYEREFALQIYEQIKGFGDYGFPESHSASFALLAYVSAWLKCHYPEVFCWALLNSQPMGFCAPAQLVGDLRRHDGEVLPVDVNCSGIESTLEWSEGNSRPALRLGLHRVRGLSRRAMEAVARERLQAEFVGVSDLVRRAGLDQRDRDSLAAADALRSLAGDRHRAFWQAAGVEELPPLFAAVEQAGFDGADGELLLMLPAANEAQNILADYNSTGLSLRRHPLALLRDRLTSAGVLTAENLEALGDGDNVLVTGIVSCRQRPHTAAGVTFLTLEDETGCMNCVVWRQLAERDHRVVQGASLLAVAGRLQRADSVLHVVARRLFDLSHLLADMRLPSRDFC